MISIHLQNSTRDWPKTANTKANGGYGHRKVTKLLFGVERALEVTEGKVWYRWVGDQPLPYNNFEEHAERWIRNFVDESFLKVASRVHFINGYNETLANSQGAEERARWIALHTAMAKVWKQKFRDVEPRLAHIKLIMCETAVGNDIPVEIAAASVKYDALLGYHPYIACDDKGPDVPDNQWSGINRPRFVSPHDWRWYSGRWNWMDKKFLEAGLRVTWAFGEMGPVLDASHTWAGWLDPIGGWKSCLGGDVYKYDKVMRYWLDNATKTQAYNEDRIIGGVLFTTGAPRDGQWDTFELRDWDLEHVINETNNYPYPKKTGTFDPPPPPPPVVATCEPRVQYRREYRCLPQETSFDTYMAVCADAYWDKSTVGFSYDDAGIGKLDNKTAVLFDLEPEDVPNFKDWYAKYYPGTKISLKESPDIGREISINLSLPFNREKAKAVISQEYGENYAKYMMAHGVPGHNGIDYVMLEGTQVLAAQDGVVARSGFDKDGYGYFIVLSHADGVETRYAHLLGLPTLKVGDSVLTGNPLGTVGNTGWSTGTHLHFALHVDGVARDPAPYMYSTI